MSPWYPTMSDPVNPATRAVGAYLQLPSGVPGEEDVKDAYQDALTDLLADLLHYSDEEDIDFEAALDTAAQHYADEKLASRMAHEPLPTHNTPST